MRTSLLCLVVIASAHLPAFAWNALGHKVIAEIAWETLSPEKQSKIADTLKRHPRYAEDFRDLETDQEIFLHAATWPDIARGIRGPDRDKFDKPIWHYVNFPIGDGKTNLATNPKESKSISWNVMQATNFCESVVNSDAPPQEKALAYSWLLHLVGDAHQPMHSTALFSERFPKGDRGGNSLKLAKGQNLHSVWDNFIGRSHALNNVRLKAYQLKAQPEFWDVDTTGNISDWIEESHKLAVEFAYDDAILKAILGTEDIPPIVLPESYYKQAGEHARARVVAAGLRLGAMLGGNQEHIAKNQTSKPAYDSEVEDRSPLAAEPTSKVNAKIEVSTSPATGYWLNTNTNVRHNPSCTNFKNTKNGRHCGPNEGKPCGICGG
ncbi:S1/P1 nuclease [Bythopirellula polymerisocia]|uniref:S1/P1 Nuclease n=1 Tax=Bythopirellula polymerisocia TaxID=2528003 RepID=A0A5C6CY35_9BACT|nr:S1/P1 nuclease [Bythopirellula polymerisocia]TWU27559.1 S1/P1 Nuclease [Bythopirellula polymerisocia]